MPNLTPFWRMLESRPDRSAVMLEWRRAADACHAAIEPLLLPMDSMAKRYPDPDRPGCWLKVVEHDNGDIVAINESDWKRRISLKHDDIVLHQLGLNALRKAICDALSGLMIARTPLDADASQVRIANWEPKKAASFPAFLLMCQGTRSLSQAAVQLSAASEPKGTMLFTPTRQHWTEAINDLARKRKMILVALDEVLDATPDGFEETPAWGEYLDAFCQLVKTTLPANYRNRKPPARRAKRATDIEKLEKAMEDHLRAARDYAYQQIDRGQEATLLPRPEQQMLARQLDMSISAVSRCLNDPQAEKLRAWWEAANSLEAVMKFRR